MRLLTLCSLATEHEEIPYAAVAGGLEVPLSEVEPWVVAAIGAKLIEAKMDQLTATVGTEGQRGGCRQAGSRQLPRRS